MHLSITQGQNFINKIKETSDVLSQDDSLTLDKLVQDWKSLQFDSGSVVLLLFSNSKTFLKNILAVLLAGYVPALIAPSTPLGRVNAIATSFNAKAIIKPKLFVSQLENFHMLTKIDGHDVVILNNSSDRLTNPGEIILTTSGTSGFSTGCVFDFISLVKNAEKHAEVIGLKHEDVVLVNLPLFYSYAFVAQALASYVKGASLIISSPPFNYLRYLHDIEKYAVTISSVTPLLIKDFLSHSVEYPVCLRAITVGGDTLDPKYIKALLAELFEKKLYITYGITEAGPRVATLAAHAEPIQKLSSVGKLLPGTVARLDTNGYSNNKGELLIYSDTLVKKRLGQATKPLFVTIDGVSWLKTGDIFSIDADGYLFYHSRISDFIILNGEKVNLADIKKMVALQFGALSTKITLVKGPEGLIGYDLDIIVKNIADKNLESIKRDIRNNLKLYERPRNIEVTMPNSNDIERYK
jgi:long-chain acyl-CoA synthetase